MWWLLALSAAQADVPDVWFRYDFTRRVDHGTGAYQGYTEQLTSSGRYDVRGFDGEEPSVDAKYDWEYSSSEPKFESGTTVRATRFAKADRRYRAPIDLDDEAWAAVDPASLAVWFWIPPDTGVGASVQLLDQACTVSARDGTAPDGVRAAIVCTSTGVDSRDDAYGKMAMNWTETSYFDPATGFIVAQTRSENDEGTTEGAYATFQLTETLIVAEASYAAALPAPVTPVAAVAPEEWEPREPREPTYMTPETAGGLAGLLISAIAALGSTVMMFGAGLAIVAFVGVLMWMKRPPTSIRHPVYGEVRFVRATAAIELAKYPTPTATVAFRPFLEDFARKAITNGDMVILAIAGGGTNGPDLVGFGLTDGETKLGTVLAPDADVAIAVRQWLGCTEFFTETRHERPPGKRLYNVFETLKVMRLDAIGELAYDTRLVTAMTPADKEAVYALARVVNPGVPVDKWLTGQIAAGDLGYVARVDGKIVGFGFATAIDVHGRLHTLAVDPAHRDKGIGKELVRARLSALRDLGVVEVISEISESAPASMHIARQLGFKEIGVMLVETTRDERVDRPIVRR